MYRSLVIVSETDGNYSACSPDLPGCVATGATRGRADAWNDRVPYRGAPGGWAPDPAVTLFSDLPGGR